MSAANRAKRDAILRQLEASIPQTYQQDQWLQDFTPEQLQQMQQLGPSAMENVATDPRLQAAQMSALQGLQDRSQSGYDATDRAAMAEAQMAAARQEQGQRGAIMQNMQARGMGGSGAELAAQLANQQGSANRMSATAGNIAGEGRQRALQAMMQSGQMAGQMQGADFNRQAQIAQARDQISQFNTTNNNKVQAQNNAMINQARMANQQGRQGVASGNTSGQNQFNQNQFQNKQGVAQVQYNAATNDINNQIAKDAEKKRIQQAQMGAIAGVAGAGVGAAAGGPAGASAGWQIGSTLGQNF